MNTPQASPPVDTHRPGLERFNPVRTLSDAEYAVFLLLGDGLRTAEIAKRLGKTDKTVSSQFHNMKRKLGLKDGFAVRAFAARFSERMGKPIMRRHYRIAEFCWDPAVTGPAPTGS